MELRKLGPNETELKLKDSVVFFSYNTPVAACLIGGGFVRTNKHYSVTTSKHINRWLDGVEAKLVEQSVLDGLVE
jgi:hypothetical protein